MVSSARWILNCCWSADHSRSRISGLFEVQTRFKTRDYWVLWPEGWNHINLVLALLSSFKGGGLAPVITKFLDFFTLHLSRTKMRKWWRNRGDVGKNTYCKVELPITYALCYGNQLCVGGFNYSWFKLDIIHLPCLPSVLHINTYFKIIIAHFYH